MRTVKFGPPSWQSIHFITYPYPDKKIKPQYYHQFFESLGHVLPCIYCRNSYQQFCKELVCDKYNSDSEIFYWGYQIHNNVNDKLRNQGNDIEPNPTLGEVKKKYSKLNPNIWYPCLTKMINFICYNYSNRDYHDKEIREWHQKFFWNLSRVLPSKKLRIQLQNKIKEYPIHNYLKNGNDLFYWAYLIGPRKLKWKDLRNYYEQCKATKCNRVRKQSLYSRDIMYDPKEYTLVFDLFRFT